jgi:hypothetical protein
MKLTQSCVALSMTFLLSSGTTGLEGYNAKEQTPAPNFRSCRGDDGIQSGQHVDESH